MKKVSIAEVLSALDAEIAMVGILIGSNMDAEEIARMYHSDAQSDEEALNMMKAERKIIYFFSFADCPILTETHVDLLISNHVYIVKLI